MLGEILIEQDLHSKQNFLSSKLGITKWHNTPLYCQLNHCHFKYMFIDDFSALTTSMTKNEQQKAVSISSNQGLLWFVPIRVWWKCYSRFFLISKWRLLINENRLIITNLPGNTSEMTLAANKLTHISTNNITTYNKQTCKNDEYRSK